MNHNTTQGKPGHAHILKGLFRLMDSYRLLFFAAVTFQLLNVACGIFINLIIRDYTDNVVTSPAPSAWLHIFAFLALAALQGFSAFFGGKSNSRMSEGITRDLRHRLFDHIQRLSFTYHDGMPTGELIQRVTSDVGSINRFYGMQLSQITRVFFLFAINWGVILMINTTLGLLSVVLVPFIFMLSVMFFSRISRAFDAFQVQDARVSTMIQENLSGVRVVKAFARQDFETEKFEQENRAKFLAGRKFTMSHALYWPVSHILCSVQTVGGIAAAGYMTYTGTISLGTLLAFSGMLSQIIWPLQNLGRVIADLSTAFISYSRVSEILDTETEDLSSGREPSLHLHGVIECRNLSFNYHGGHPALKNVSFSCRQGEKIALIGEPGSGKTTFINLLPRFYEVSGGSLTIDGVDIRRFPKNYLRKHIGIVEQQPFLFSATIGENIAYGISGTDRKDVSEDEIRRAADLACIADSIETFPLKYQTLVGEKGVTLSGGQKQRIAIARTILKDPSILILDDATSAVDARTEEQIRTALNRLMEGRTTFIIAHRIASVIDADQILVFKDGEIIQQGTHESLMKEEGFYNTVCTLQTGIEEDLSRELSDV